MTRMLVSLFIIACQTQEGLVADYVGEQEGRIKQLEADLTACRAELAKRDVPKSASAASTQDEKEQPCTLEWLQANEPRKLEEVEAELRKERVARASELGQLSADRELASQLPPEPIGLPELPVGVLAFGGVLPEDCPIEVSGYAPFCYASASCLSREGDGIPDHAERFEGSWQHLVTLIGHRYSRGLGDEETRYDPTERDYVAAVYFVTGFLPAASPWGDEYMDLDWRVRSALLGVVHDEDKLRAAGSWLAPFALRLIPDSELPRARWFIAALWTASHADMRALDALVRSPEGGFNYLIAEGKKLEGLFLRRWRHIVPQQHADDMFVVYRFWLTRAAAIFKMDQARHWAAEARRDLGNCTTLHHKEWYIAELGKIKG